MEQLSVRQARRLALVRAGLLKPEWTGLPRKASGRGVRARRGAQAVVERFGYLQLDTVSIAGARSHTIVLLSRLEGMHHQLGEELLQQGRPLFEYWGHEACWIPMELYPAFGFRRKAYRIHPWYGDVLGEHRGLARDLKRRIRAEGALRSVDLEGPGGRGWWDFKVAKRVANALWSAGELAIAERVNFQRSYDLVDRVIPDETARRKLSKAASLELLVLKALDGHGWATTQTIVQTWRLSSCRRDVLGALERLVAKGEVLACELENPKGRPSAGWIRTADLELAARTDALRPRSDRGVLLSPFDPVLWDRDRVRRLFGFDQILEIFKPQPKRVYGYYCLPVLAGDQLVARFDFKAERAKGKLRVLSRRFEGTGTERPPTKRVGEAARTALERYAEGVGLGLG